MLQNSFILKDDCKYIHIIIKRILNVKPVSVRRNVFIACEILTDSCTRPERKWGHVTHRNSCGHTSQHCPHRDYSTKPSSHSLHQIFFSLSHNLIINAVIILLSVTDIKGDKHSHVHQIKSGCYQTWQSTWVVCVFKASGEERTKI